MRGVNVLVLCLFIVLGRPDGAQAFSSVTSHMKVAPHKPAACHHSRPRRSTALLSNNDNNNENTDWITERIERADLLGIRRDAILAACFVLCRFFVYDISTGAKTVPGWELQDVVLLTGTASSAIVLVTYWTIAGLLSRSFENDSSEFRPLEILVNVALSCPIWLATEHLLEFGPPNIGGSSLDEAVLNGFVGLSLAMLLGRALTSKWQ